MFRFPTIEQINSDIPKLAKSCDVVIADSPAGLKDQFTTQGIALLDIADYALIPARPGFFEISALKRNLAIIAEIKARRSGKPVSGVVMTHASKHFKLVPEMLKASEDLGFKFVPQTISLCQAYAQAPGLKKFIWDMPGKQQEATSREIDALFSMLFGMTGKKTVVQKSIELRMANRSKRRRVANG